MRHKLCLITKKQPFSWYFGNPRILITWLIFEAYEIILRCVTTRNLRVLRKNRVVLYDRISILFVDKILRKQTWKKLGRRSRKSIFFKLWHKMWHNYCHMTRSSCLYTYYILLVSLLYVVTSMTYTVVPTVRFMFNQVVDR